MSYDESNEAMAGWDGELYNAIATVTDRVVNGTMRADDRRDLSLILAHVSEQAKKLEAARNKVAELMSAYNYSELRYSDLEDIQALLGGLK